MTRFDRALTGIIAAASLLIRCDRHDQGGRRARRRVLRRLRLCLRLRSGSGRRARRARQMHGRLQGRAGAPRLRRHRHRRPQRLRRAWLCDRNAIGRGAEHRAAALLQVRRQGLRDPRLGLRRQRLTTATEDRQAASLRVESPQPSLLRFPASKRGMPAAAIVLYPTGERARPCARAPSGLFYD